MKEIKTIKHQEGKYKEYVENHIKNVKQVWVCFEAYDIFPSLNREIEKLVNIHDISKFSKEEFDGYRQFFYTAEGEEKSQEAFDKAWQHHYHNNPHHWEYWTNHTLDVIPAYKMPLQYIVEMLCDWTAMSLVFGDEPSEFYKKKKEAIVIHKQTRKIIDNLLPCFDDIARANRRVEG